MPHINLLGGIYLTLLFGYTLFAQWLRKFRTVIIYGDEVNWNELTYKCIVETREYNKKNLITKAYQYLILGLYYNLMDGAEMVDVVDLYRMRKGARAYRKKRLEKALRYFDKISKGRYQNEALKHFGHIYDLIGNYYRKQDDPSIAIGYYLKSKGFKAKVKDWNNVDILERKIKELNV